MAWLGLQLNKMKMIFLGTRNPYSQPLPNWLNDWTLDKLRSERARARGRARARPSSG